MKKQQTFDVIVIGSGPSGGKIASACNKAGWKVAVVDKEFGGTCALHGCTPKKAIETVATLIAHANALQGHGFPEVLPKLDWSRVQLHKAYFTSMVTASTKKDYRESGMTLFEGEAAFTGKKTLKVGDETLTAKHIVVATGSRPRPLAMEGAEHIINSNHFLDMPTMPKSVVFVGGGYIGFELAHIARATGAEVTIISREDLPLPQFDSDLVQQLIKATLAKGIRVVTGMSAEQVVQKGKQYIVHYANKNGEQQQQLTTKLVVNTSGRVPAIAALNLEEADVDFTEKGITINELFQSTSNKNVYAVGDVNGKIPLTPVSGTEAKVLSNYLLEKEESQVAYGHYPTVLFTSPKLASVGKMEADLREEGIEYVVKNGEMTDWLVEKVLHTKEAGYKLLLDKKEEKLLGAHLLGNKADELINVFAFMIHNDLTVKQFLDTPMAFPTAMSALKSAF